jgi:hypothetical protein
MSTPVTYHDVLVLHATDRGWLCRIGDGQVFIARTELAADTVMPTEGQRGTVTIEGFAADRIRKALRS